MSLENRLRRVESKFEDVSPGELPAPVSQEHEHVRKQIRQVEREYSSLPPRRPGRRRSWSRRTTSPTDTWILCPPTTGFRRARRCRTR